MITNSQNLKSAIKRDVEFTSGNYAQMYKRLRLNDAASRFFMVYYSTISIVYGLFPLYFNDKIVSKSLFDFLMISLSIVVLIASLLISFAQYDERCKRVMSGLDRLKRLKKKLLLYDDGDLTKEQYSEFVEEYHNIVDNIELRSDFDYFRTCKELKERGKYEEGWNRISCTNKILMFVFSFSKGIFFLLLFVFPVIMLLCVL